MPNCPICQMELREPPEDVRDWFRCDNCGTPLQVPSQFGRILFWISTVVCLIVLWVFSYVGMRYLRMVFPGLELHLPLASMAAIVLGTYALLIRWLWKTKLVRPRPCDPYSALGLSDDRKKMRGR